MNNYRVAFVLGTTNGKGKTPELYVNVQAFNYGQAEQIGNANINQSALELLKKYKINYSYGSGKIVSQINSITFSGGAGNVTPVGSFCADLERQIVELKTLMNKYAAINQPAPLNLQMKYEKLVALYSQKCNQNSDGGLGGMIGGSHKFSGFDGVDGLVDDLF